MKIIKPGLTYVMVSGIIQSIHRKWLDLNIADVLAFNIKSY